MNPKDRAGSKKPNLSIIPLRPLYEVALALYEGARKYGPWNWRDEHVDETIYVDAAIRHLNQWVAGEDIDPDSGLPHISKAIAGLVILRDAQVHSCSIDTRRAKQNVDFPDLVARQEAINEKYPNPVGTPQLTEEQAEKAAEAYGITDLINNVPVEKFSLTPAGAGSYVITEDDVGKRVVCRSGREAVIYEWDDSTWPVCYREEAEQRRLEAHYDDCVCARGYACGDSSKIMDQEAPESMHDIVKVIH